MAETATGWMLTRPGVSVSEMGLVISVLRLMRDDRQSPARLGEAFGIRWPETPNTTAHGRLRVAWMAPGQWALFGAGPEMQAAVAEACGAESHHVAEVSAGRRLWRLEGEQARAVIAKGCSLDTHPRTMLRGQCARTLFADVPVLLISDGSGHSFEIIADVSFAGHLRAWFHDATLEFAL